MIRQHSHLCKLKTIVDDTAAGQLLDDLFEALAGRMPKGPVAAAVGARLSGSMRPEVNMYVRPNLVQVALLELGARDEALRFVERSVTEAAVDPRNRGIFRIVLASAPVGDLRCEPRYQAALQKINVVDGLAREMCK